ncbi:N-formylglutamate amidohydrolase [Kiloniella laminariae]|uniref:N-formylglutamate amidohydrolase n=1 Tax=Kiloniella laminariae TaxID=454162 RepID=UPI000378E468|nr:N-formylglutamate amidohydrolase [Kiloniella laminariae]
MSTESHNAENTGSANSVVETSNLAGAGDFLIVCEHASNYIPPAYNNLGLDETVLKSHVAWDPGALAVAQALSKALDAPLVEQKLSRLIYDCNRPPEAENAMPAQSEIFTIPGNSNLSQADRDMRTNSVYVPFRSALTDCLDQLQARGQSPVVITVHSFTPVYKGVKRDVEIGFLHDRDDIFAKELIKTFAAETDKFVLRLNEPYGPADGVTHTLTEHALPRNLRNVMLEIRNDLITDPESQQDMATVLAQAILQAEKTLGKKKNHTAPTTKPIKTGN